MSQMITRKGHVGDDKDKRQTNSPVKDMKKKMAANAEKEKQAAEKHAEKEKDKSHEKHEKADKHSDKAEKHTEKADKHHDKADKQADKHAEKAEKHSDKAEKHSDKADKNVEKPEKEKKAEKSSDKKEKVAEKEKGEKSAEKKSEPPAEKPKEDKSAKNEKPDEKKKPDTPKPKQNGARANGVETHNGAEDSDSMVSSEEEMVIDHEKDDMFPELAYEDSDGEFEPPTPEGLPSRSYTRRSQVKVARTPETPRPASDKQTNDREIADDSKETKVLKMKDDTPSTDRKLRSSDSPKPQDKKADKKPEKEAKEGEDKQEDKTAAKKADLEVQEENEANKDKSTCDVEVIEIDNEGEASRGSEGGEGEGEGAEGGEGRVKPDTNYSKSRVKVSPYRRSLRLADQTTSSVMANYTGNNTTMEMDITETSSFIDDTPADSPYLSGLRSIRGRRSYKPLKEMTARNISVNRSVRSTTSVAVTENPTRPTGTVVGRKRKPDGDDAEAGAEAAGAEGDVRTKRARLLEKLARPFRTLAATPLPARRNAEIVGINTDLPLTAPVASPDTFDPESLKVTSTPLAAPSPATLTPLTPAAPLADERDSKRCVVM